jgi:REP element-mobilizing transposase RayT
MPERKNSRSKAYWLVTTEHLKKGLWFRDDEDYRIGMNYAAIASFACGVMVLAFVLMSNHVHFVLYCTEEEARAFINEFKADCSRHLALKYGVRDLLRRNRAVIERISPDDESFERAVAYVQMNPPAANICLHPTGYPWGTGSLFFNGLPPKGIRLGDLSRHAIRKRLRTKRSLPADWLLGEDGYILPESYVPVTLVESIFRTPKRMNFFLQNSSKARRRQEFRGNELPSFRDQVLYAAIPDLCQSLFGRNTVSDLDQEQKTELVRQLRRRFCSDVRQIARVTSLPMEEAARLLDAP